MKKILLIKDLCARLPYGVICKTHVGDYKLLGIDEDSVHLDSPVYDEGDGYFDLEYQEVKPYLRPMSSMTEEEKTEYFEMHVTGIDSWYIVDWLNKRHLDYHYLIDKGLALEAPEGMYNI